MSTTGAAMEYEHMIGRVSQATGVDREDVDAILTVCAGDAVPLIH